MEARKGPILMGFAGLTLMLFGPALSSGDHIIASPEYNDILPYFAPFHTFLRQTLLAGEWPFRVPAILAGMPTAMAAQDGLFYPLNWLTLFIDSHRAMDVQTALHFFIALCAASHAARRLGFSRASATGVALMWALSGAMVGRLSEGHLTVYQALAWYPLFWQGCYMVALSPAPAPRDRQALLAGGGVLGLIGAPQVWTVALITGGLAALSALWRPPTSKSDPDSPPLSSRSLWRQRLLSIGRVVGGIALGLAISAPAWAPVAEVAGETARARLAPEFEIWEMDYPPIEFLTLLVPSLLKDQSNENRITIGAAGFLLALMGWGLARNRAMRNRLIALTAITLLFCLGTRGGLQSLLTTLFPPFEWVAGGTRFAFALTWLLCLSAGLGLEALGALSWRRPMRWRNPVPLRWAICACLLLELLVVQRFGFVLCPVDRASPLPDAVAMRLAQGAPIGRTLNLAPELRNASLTLGYEDVNGYAANLPARFVEMAAWSTGLEPRASHLAHYNRPTETFCRLFAVQFLIAHADPAHPPDPARWTPLWEDRGLGVWETTRPFPRVTALAAAGDDGLEAALFRDLTPWESEQTGAIVWQEKANSRMSWDFPKMDAPAWLVAHETWSGGWRAWVDGRRAPVHRVWHGLCAIALPPNARQVELIYRPRTFLPALLISALTLMLLGAGWTCGRWRRRPSTVQASGGPVPERGL